MHLSNIQYALVIGFGAFFSVSAFAQPAPQPLPPVNLPSPAGLPPVNSALPVPPTMPPSALPLPQSSSAVTPSVNPAASPVASPSVAGGPTTTTAPENASNSPASLNNAELAPGVKQFSYGKSSLSILFMPAQMERMKSAIRTFESSDKKVESTFVAPTPSIAPVEEKIVEPQSYPVFYLASIAYDSDAQWSLWISGHKITARKNDTDISVVSISPDSATFLWKPEFMKAVVRRKADESFAPTDPVKNKLATTQRAYIDEDLGAVRFTLRQNQSFVSGYFSVFEGFVDSPKLEPLLAPVNDTLDLSTLQSPSSPPMPVPQAMPPQGIVPPAARP